MQKCLGARKVSALTGKRKMPHGHCADGKLTPTYSSWGSMRTRCLNPKNISYKYYGGKGIKITKRWSKFENFLEDMGPRPSIQHSLERNNNKKSYRKNNCCWILKREQPRHRDYAKLSMPVARLIRTMYASERFTQAELAKEFNISASHMFTVIHGTYWAEA